VPVYFLKAKQGYAVRETGKRKIGIAHVDKCRYEIQERKEVPVNYGIPVHTDPFRALI
jgi:hypothetical protein